jgi:hypothetical protein
MRKSHTEKLPRKAGRPHGRAPRPHIQIDGDTLVPKVEAAEELGIAVRTLTRMRPASTLIGGVSYLSMAKLRQQLADKLAAPKKRRARR